MESSISVALAGQVALRRRIDIVANNLANTDTAGFRLESQIVQNHGGRNEGTIYPLDRGSFTDVRAGSLVATGSQLDVALEGPGWLGVTTPAGPRYSRDGRMRTALDGTLLGAGGYPVMGDGGAPLIVPTETVTLTITDDGTVIADLVEIGRIAVFEAEGASTREAGELVSFDLEPQPATATRLRQGTIERSNVEPLRELVDMLEVQRGYERLQEILDGEDQRIRQLVDRSVRV